MEFEYGQYKMYALIFIFGLITAEIIWSWKNDKRAYDVKDTLGSKQVLQS